MNSYKYTWVVLSLLLLALIPTVSGFYKGVPVLTERMVESLPKELAGMKGIATARKGKVIQNGFRTGDWMERIYTDNSGRTVTLFAVRGYDGRPLFHFPERGLLQRNWSERTYVIKTLSDGNVRVKAHVLHLTGTVENKKVFYLLFYGKETVGNPYTFLLSRIPMMLMGDSKPFTFLFAYCTEREKPGDMDPVIKSLLFAAFDYFSNLNLQKS
ncbi:MAG: hypothetical protein GY737_22035 [Desulfobacteraceae bacterium]|nr:hypothetical protein [Desulfobacteraceae bacterium]